MSESDKSASENGSPSTDDTGRIYMLQIAMDTNPTGTTGAPPMVANPTPLPRAPL
jgi:hypothetical protein